MKAHDYCNDVHWRYVCQNDVTEASFVQFHRGNNHDIQDVQQIVIDDFGTIESLPNGIFHNILAHPSLFSIPIIHDILPHTFASLSDTYYNLPCDEQQSKLLIAYHTTAATGNQDARTREKLKCYQEYWNNFWLRWTLCVDQKMCARLLTSMVALSENVIISPMIGYSIDDIRFAILIAAYNSFVSLSDYIRFWTMLCAGLKCHSMDSKQHLVRQIWHRIFVVPIVFRPTHLALLDSTMRRSQSNCRQMMEKMHWLTSAHTLTLPITICPSDLIFGEFLVSTCIDMQMSIHPTTTDFVFIKKDSREDAAFPLSAIEALASYWQQTLNTPVLLYKAVIFLAAIPLTESSVHFIKRHRATIVLGVYGTYTTTQR